MDKMRNEDGRCVVCDREYDESKDVCQFCECPCGRSSCETCDLNLDLQALEYDEEAA